MNMIEDAENGVIKACRERAEKAERERDELAAHIELLKKNFMAGANDQALGEIFDNPPSFSFAQLRAKHWREACDQADSFESECYFNPIAQTRKMADAVERGES